MPTINPYLTFEGNCEEVFNFYKSVFGGEFQFIGRFKDMPLVEGQEISESEKEKIMHISLPISKETILMGSDTSTTFGQNVTVGTNFSVSIHTDSEAEATRLFNGLSKGGQVVMPLNNTFWGSFFGMFTDKYNIQWMVSFELNEEEK